MNKDSKALVRKLRKQGYTVTDQGRGSHKAVYLDGHRITSLGMASSPVNIRNTIAQVRRRTRAIQASRTT